MSCVVKQVFLVRKIRGHDAGTMYAMKVLKKATLKGELITLVFVVAHYLYIRVNYANWHAVAFLLLLQVY